MSKVTDRFVHGPTLLRHATGTLLAVALLVSGVMGRSGVQVLDRATLAALSLTHLHGVPGEAAWLTAHGTWQGFLPNHCHADPDILARAAAPGPDEIQTASNLAGAMACQSSRLLPVPAVRFAPLVMVAAVVRARANPRPLLPPPQR
jgi:hypothetical protein